MTLIKNSKPVVGSPIVRACCNGLLEGRFGGVQLPELLIRAGHAAMGVIIRRFQVGGPPVFVNCLLVFTRAEECPAETDVSRCERAIAFSAFITTLLRRVRPPLVMR